MSFHATPWYSDKASRASVLSDPGAEASPAVDSPRRRGNLYGHQWRKARAAFLAAHPLCAMCEEDGKLEPARVVDHIRPHKGDLALFWDRSNWQPLCKTHHDATKQRAEATGHAPGHDASGMPTDPAHPWARAATRGMPVKPLRSPDQASVGPLRFHAVNCD